MKFDIKMPDLFTLINVSTANGLKNLSLDDKFAVQK